MIGPIRGDSNIAPMTTAGDDSSSPRTAIPADMAIMNMYRADMAQSSRRFAITVA